MNRFVWSVVLALVVLAHQATFGQSRPARASYEAPRTPWGDPDLQGYYTNSDESLIPMERPDALTGKSLSDISADELARLNEQRNEDRLEAGPGSLSIRRTARSRRRRPPHAPATPRAPRRARGAATPTRTRTAVSTTAASRAACPGR